MYYELNNLIFSPVVTTRCNLRCNHCGYGCTSKNSNLDADSEKLMDSVRHLYKLFKEYKGDATVQIGFLGGEPLLYKNLPKILDFMSAECPDFNRDIVTNGLMAPYVDFEILDAIQRNDFQLDISRYPIKDYDYNKLLWFLHSLGIKAHIIETEMQHIEGVKQTPNVQNWFHEHFYSSENIPTPFKDSNECRQLLKGMACIVIWNEYILPCSNIFEVLNNQISDGKYLDIPITDLDMFKVKNIMSIEDLINILYKNYPFCNYCHGGELREWSTDTKVKLL